MIKKHLLCKNFTVLAQGFWWRKKKKKRNRNWLCCVQSQTSTISIFWICFCVVFVFLWFLVVFCYLFSLSRLVFVCHSPLLHVMTWFFFICILCLSLMICVCIYMYCWVNSGLLLGNCHTKTNCILYILFRLSLVFRSFLLFPSLAHHLHTDRLRCLFGFYGPKTHWQLSILLLFRGFVYCALDLHLPNLLLLGIVLSCSATTRQTQRVFSVYSVLCKCSV